MSSTRASAARFTGLTDVYVGMAMANRWLRTCPLQDFYISFGPMHANPLPIFDQFGGILHADDCR